VASLFDGRFRERSDCDDGRDAKKQQVREERMQARDFKKTLEVPVCTSHVEAFDKRSMTLVFHPTLERKRDGVAL